jgi:acyl carrier protein
MDDEFAILIEYIRNESGYTGEVRPDDDLLQARILDSFSIVSLALFAQERFAVEFEEQDLVRDNLARLSSLVRLIRQRRETASAA